MRSERLRHIADIRVSNVDKKSVEGQVPVRLCNYTDVYYNERITAALEFMDSTATPEQCIAFQLAPGDVLLTKDSETPDDIGVTAVVTEAIPHLLCGYHLALIRPRPGVDGRYLRFALASSPARSDLGSRSNGITRFGLRSSVIGDVTVPLPTLDGQRAIADYLDRETARTDTLIEKKQRLVELYRSRSWRCLHALIDDSRAPLLPIRRVLKFITDGPFGSAFSSNDYSEEGAAVVRLANIGFGEYRYEDQAYIPMSLYQEFPRCHVAAGDVLIAGLGDANNHAGRACVAPDLGPAMVKGKCFCARVDRSRAIPEYVSWLLSSTLGAELVGAFGQGSTRTMINLEVIKALDVPMPSMSTQMAIVEAFDVERARSRTAAEFARRQIALLSENRQALITAAVSGQMSIPGAA